jgi:fucose 4-O-acetylase-like acetyltransferase
MNHDNSINVAKGLVIAAVVLGHVLEAELLNCAGSRLTESCYRLIYLFHMPFWFLLSGYLFKTAQPAAKYFKKKFVHLIVPYLAWLIVFNLAAIGGLTANALRGDLAGEKLSFYRHHFAEQMYGGLEVHGAQMILWFPTCLFFTQQLANLLIGRCPSAKIQLVWFSAVYILGYLQQYAFPGFHLPLAFDVVAGGLPFFVVGYWLKRGLQTEKSRWASILCFVLAVYAIFVWKTPLSFHMRMAEYGIPLISTVAASGGFFVVLEASRWLNRLPASATLISWVGEASMTVMYVHAVVLVRLHSLEVHSVAVLLALGILFPALLHHLLARLPILSLLFIGTRHSPLLMKAQPKI